MQAITRQIEDLKDRLSEKDKTGLNLTDIDTVMATIESIEKRIKKDVPVGEFDWKATTMSTLGEIGKEVVSAFKEIQLSRPQQQMAPTPQQVPANDMNQVAKQKLQNYIMKNLEKGVNKLVMDEAQRTLGISPQQILQAYDELVAEGWIQGPPQQKQPPATQQQPPTQPIPQQTPPPQNEQTQNLHPGETPRDRFDANAPFLER